MYDIMTIWSLTKVNISDLTAYNGPIGKLLNGKVWELPVGDFEVIPVEDFPTLDEKVVKKLSNDAKDLYRLCLTVITGTSGTTEIVVSWLIN